MENITLNRTSNGTYFYSNQICSDKLFTLAVFLINDSDNFLLMHKEYFKNKQSNIDCGGNRTWIKEKNKNIIISVLYVKEEEYTTTKEKFFKIIEQWDQVVAERPPKIIIKEVDGEIIISPLEPYMN